MKLSRVLFAALTVLGVATVPVRLAQAQGGPTFFTHYYDVATSNSPSASGYGGKGASGGVGDGLVRIVNAGDETAIQRGTICALIYVFDDIEEMQACCGCPITPDGLRTLSVINNVTKNFGVNRGNMNAGVIDIISVAPNLLLPKPVPLPPQIGSLSPSPFACDPSFQYGAKIGVPQSFLQYVPGMEAWITHSEANAPVPFNSGGMVKGVSVDEFVAANLDDTHFSELIDFCSFLISNGSGTGACSCGSGDSFSKAPQPD